MSDLARVLAEVPNVRCVFTADAVRLVVPGVVEVSITASSVLRAEAIVDPFGDRAALLLVELDGQPTRGIVSRHDFVFEPRTVQPELDFLPAGLHIEVREMPDLVGYTEMMEALADAERRLTSTRDVDAALGTVVMLRRFIAGAERFGIDCTEARAMWEGVREALKGM